MVTKMKTPATDDEVDLTGALTPEELSKILRVSIKTLASWRSNLTPDKPPFVQLSRRAVLYPRRQFEQWMNRRKLVTPGAK